jgi:hypothetical protein
MSIHTYMHTHTHTHQQHLGQHAGQHAGRLEGWRSQTLVPRARYGGRARQALPLGFFPCPIRVSDAPPDLLLMRHITSASVSIRQHTSAYVSVRQHTSAYVSIRQSTSAYVSIRQHTSAYVSIREVSPAYDTFSTCSFSDGHTSSISCCICQHVKYE